MEWGVDALDLQKLADYWELAREPYAPFECGLKAGTADVYLHEMPGGQYSNLRAQAFSLGLGPRWEEIKRKYREVNDMCGDIIKVTPSSKAVGTPSCARCGLVTRSEGGNHSWKLPSSSSRASRSRAEHSE